MPAFNLTAYDPNNRTLNELCDNEIKKRQGAIDTYWQYYHGNHPKPLRVEIGDRDDNIILNLCGHAVDKEVAFFAPEPPTFEFPGAPAATDETVSPENAALDTLLKNNDFDELISDMALGGFVSGHNFVKLYIDSTDPQPTLDTLKFSLLDARMCCAIWDITNRKRTLFYRIQWSDGDYGYRQDIIPASLVGQGAGWLLIDYVMNRGGKWNEVKRETWQWDFAPIVTWKNTQSPYDYYGDSDLKHYNLNNAINFIASNNAKIIRHHASPRVVVTGSALAEDFDGSLDRWIEFPDKDAKAAILEPKADLVSSMNMLNMLVQNFYNQMRVIDLSTVKDNLGQITNFGVQMLFSDMSANTRNKHKLYGKALSEIVYRAMTMLGFAVERPTVKWADPLPIDRVETVDALVKEVKDLGVSKDTAQTMLGHDPAEETRKRELERMERVQDETAINSAGAFGNVVQLGRAARLREQQMEPML